MELQKQSPGKFALNYGLITGVAMILLAAIMYVTGLGLEGVQWPNWIYYAFFAGIIFYTINAYKKANAGVLSLGEAIKIGLTIAGVSAVIAIAYGYVFENFIDPEYIQQALKFQEDKLLENSSMSPEQKELQMKTMESMMSATLRNAILLGFSLIFGLIYSLIGGLIMKKESGDA